MKHGVGDEEGHAFSIPEPTEGLGEEMLSDHMWARDEEELEIETPAPTGK